jgi:hypothetical protein
MNSHVQNHSANAERATRLQCIRAPKPAFAAARAFALSRLRRADFYTRDSMS